MTASTFKEDATVAIAMLIGEEVCIVKGKFSPENTAKSDDSLRLDIDDPNGQNGLPTLILDSRFRDDLEADSIHGCDYFLSLCSTAVS